jgi:hypothetical protein
MWHVQRCPGLSARVHRVGYRGRLPATSTTDGDLEVCDRGHYPGLRPGGGRRRQERTCRLPGCGKVVASIRAVPSATTTAMTLSAIRMALDTVDMTLLQAPQACENWCSTKPRMPRHHTLGSPSRPRPRIYTAFMAFTLISEGSALPVPPSRAGPLTTPQASRHATDRIVAAPCRALDSGLRRRAFPSDAASLLPGLLAAPRTGLSPAGDDGLTNSEILLLRHSVTSLLSLGARKIEVNPPAYPNRLRCSWASCTASFCPGHRAEPP